MTIADLLVDHAPEALLLLDAEGLVRSWNPAARRIFGHDADQAMAQFLPSLIGTAAGCLLTDERPISSHSFIASRRDGEPIGVYGRVQRLPDGTRLCMLGDVSAQRAAEDHQFLRARYGQVFDSMPDAIVIVNALGRIVHLNRQAVTLFGHPVEAAVGSPMEILLPHRLRAQHVPQRSAYQRAPGLRPMGQGLDLHGLHADGHEFPVEISLSPIEVDGRQLVISAIRDIGDRKTIELALHQKNVELERASRAKDHFLAAMSHELRTPLNAILGFTGLMLMKLPGPLTETQERHLQHVQSSGRHLLSLINDLLDLAKVESGHVELVGEDVDVQALCNEVLEAMRPTAQAKGLALGVELASHPAMVHADRRALHQVVLNLVGNAVKFTPQGAVLIRVPACTRGQPWRIEVEDTGVGIDEADQARLFQAFVQVGDRPARRGEGTGLGLHLSRRLAELMGGSLTLRSRLGEGSCFTLELPAEAAWR